jgi:nucleotide-binding universal stress UspA family protein
MLPVHTILHPTDFSEGSAFAFRLACALARDYDARLIVLHVAVPPMPVYGERLMTAVLPDAAQERLRESQLRQQLAQLHPKDVRVQVEHRLIEGYPVAEILTVAKEERANVILMGTHGRTGLGRLLMGSVAEEVVRQAPCPVVTVKIPVPAMLPAKGAAPRTAETAAGIATE